MDADAFANILSAIGLIVAGFALVLGLVVARLTLSQTRRLHDATAELAEEEYERARFDELFAHSKEILEHASTLAAYTDWRWRGRTRRGDENMQAVSADDTERALSRLSQAIELLPAVEHLLPIRGGLATPDSVSEFGVRTHPVGRLMEQAAWLNGSADALYGYQRTALEQARPEVEGRADADEDSLDELRMTDIRAVGELLSMRMVENMGDLVSSDPAIWQPMELQRQKEMRQALEFYAANPAVTGDPFVLAVIRSEFHRSLTQFRTALIDLMQSYADARRMDDDPRRASRGFHERADGVGVDRVRGARSALDAARDFDRDPLAGLEGRSAGSVLQDRSSGGSTGDRDEQ